MGNTDVSEYAYEYLLCEMIGESVNSWDKTGKDGSNNFERIEESGFHVGYRLFEGLGAQQKAISSDPLDLMKFLCKEFWQVIFRKKIDKLQTNHRGIFVLYDKEFKWLEKYVVEEDPRTQAMIFFSCGLVRGALANGGVPSLVSAELSPPTGVSFNIKVKT
jgi:hypothetical protein